MVLVSQEAAGAITGYHAHVYYDSRTRPLAEQLREAIAGRFAVQLGRWHDQPIGPHPSGSYQIAFGPALFAERTAARSGERPYHNFVRVGVNCFTGTVENSG
jgi:aromatic ring-cleaving dioxygenase